MPKISVVMAVHNAEEYLALAIDSILQQTFSDFEFIIINDGSTDQTTSILEAYSAKDPRILLLHNQENKGLPHSLNIGLDIAQGEYIARMDADDISMSQRFARQVDFMDKNPQIGICGTWVKHFGDKEAQPRAPQTDDEIKCTLFFRATLVHPSVMMRKQVLQDYHLRYDEDFSTSQDYKLWVDASPYVSFANIPKVLLHYRFHAAQISVAKLHIQRENGKKVRAKQLNRLGIQPTEEELDLHNKFSRFEQPFTREFIIQIEKWLQRLQAQNAKMAIYSEPEFSKILSTQWIKICQHSTDQGLFTWDIFSKSPVSKFVYLRKKEQLKLRIQCQLAEFKKRISFRPKI